MKSFFYKSVLTIGLFGLSHIASAVYFSSYIYEMGSEESFISKPIRNDTSYSNLYTVQSFKIDKPGVNGENVIYAKDREIIYTPLKLQIDANSTDFFKLIYIGPKDDQERYYRVVFNEVPLTAFQEKPDPKATSFVPTISMSTIMVVRPRKQKFKYELDEKTGVLKNTGNTFFRVIIHKSCKSDDESSTQFYMLPNEEYKGDLIKQKNRKFLVINQHYEQIGNQCAAEPEIESQTESKPDQSTAHPAKAEQPNSPAVTDQQNSQAKPEQTQDAQTKDDQSKDNPQPTEK